MPYYGLSLLAFVMVTFAVQASSHFAINTAHYAAIGIMRPEPIMPLGFLAMIVQGTVMAQIFPFFATGGRPVSQGLKFGILMGLFLGSYVALAEPAKYAVPDIMQWFSIEAGASLIQFSLYGLILGFVHRSFGKPA